MDKASMRTSDGFEYEFSGWATKNDLLCSDGRTIRKDAFAHNDGKVVPLVWMHNHKDITNVIGQAKLKNKSEGMYAYCSFNETLQGQHGREIVKHHDVASLSIWANQLDQRNGNVLHGDIKEVSLVLAGANPGAVIDFPFFAHSDEEDTSEAFIRVDEPIVIPEEKEISHADQNGERTVQDVVDSMNDEQRQALEFLIGVARTGEEIGHSDVETEIVHDDDGGKTVQDILDTMNEEQRKVTEYLVAMTLESKNNADAAEHSNMDDASDDNHGLQNSDEREDNTMHTNTFEAFGENTQRDPKTYLTHAEGREIIRLAKDKGIPLKMAMQNYAEANGKELMHADGDDDLGFRSIDRLFPEYKLVNPGAPEAITTDQGWITKVLNGVSKSPMSRLRTRYSDQRDIENMRAKGYKKGTLKDFRGNLDLINRTTDPITVYVKGKLDRDDIVDITDFSIVDYMYQIDRRNLNEELARAIMIGDGRSGDKAIDPTKIRPIWLDDELYCLHEVVDVQGMRTTMNGSGSSANFGDNYVYAEAIIQSLLYAREKYKGSGNPTFFCHPHLVNVMLLARDLNGRRIYDNVSQLTSALNVKEIVTVEQFEGKTRQATVRVNNVDTLQTRKILGIMVNMSDYTVGATKGGEITHFTDFDLNFNQEISLLETRCSGSLLKPWSAIALEEVVNPS